MKLLTRICRVTRRIFGDPAMNEIMCGMGTFGAGVWSLTAYLDFARNATEHSAAFAIPVACIAAAPWVLNIAVLLNLRKRTFSASTTGLNVGQSNQQQEGENPQCPSPTTTSCS